VEIKEYRISIDGKADLYFSWNSNLLIDSAAFMWLSADFFVFRVLGAVIFVYFLLVMNLISRTKDTNA
jgi:hypothetical protein